jgi:aryl-alcohol dehydrogenase-like predicted oxidoreductase
VEYRDLGRSGITVSRIALGCGNFGGVGSAPAFFGQGETEVQAVALMDAAWEAGVTLFDTADAYGGGRSELWIGSWLRRKGPDVRAGLRLCTKVFHSVEGDPRDEGLSRERIIRQVDGSLSRLGIDCVDVYLAHEPDPETPLGETLGAFEELVRAGKVRAFGLSNADTASLSLAHARVTTVQNSYSLLDREAEREMLPLCERHGVAFTSFGPLAGGWLTGKYRRGAPPPPGSRMTLRPEPYLHLDDERTHRGLERLQAAARERAVDLPTLATAWVLADPRVDSVIVGPRRPEHLAPALGFLELSPGERDELADLFSQSQEPTTG